MTAPAPPRFQMTQSDDPDIDALVETFYAAFDNRDGRAPTTALLANMFGEGATIVRLAGDKTETWSVSAFVAPREVMLTDGALAGFHEWETDARTAVAGDLACRWSRYRKAGRMNGVEYGGAGRKIFQFRRHEARWLISSILWEDDEAGRTSVIASEDGANGGHDRY